MLFLLADRRRVKQQRVGRILLQEPLDCVQLLQNARIAAVFCGELVQSLPVAGGINHGCPPDSR